MGCSLKNQRLGPALFQVVQDRVVLEGSGKRLGGSRVFLGRRFKALAEGIKLFRSVIIFGPQGISKSLPELVARRTARSPQLKALHTTPRPFKFHTITYFLSQSQCIQS